jgi:hypothetical protein
MRLEDAVFVSLTVIKDLVRVGRLLRQYTFKGQLTEPVANLESCKH